MSSLRIIIKNTERPTDFIHSTIFGKISAMFPFKSSIIISVLLGGLIAFTDDAQACQTEVHASSSVSSRRSPPDNRIRLSDSNSEPKAPTSERKLSDANIRTISDRRHISSNAIHDLPSSHRKLSDSQRKLTDSVRTLTDNVRSLSNTPHNQQTESWNRPPAVSKLSFMSSRRIQSDANISNVQLSKVEPATVGSQGLPSWGSIKTVKRSLGDVGKTKLIASVAQHTIEPVNAAIETGISHRRNATRQMAYVNPQEFIPNSESVSSPVLSQSTRRNFRNAVSQGTDAVISRPNLVDPESFRVRAGSNSGESRSLSSGNSQYSTPNASSAGTSKGPTFHNASARRKTNWKGLPQDNIETDLLPQDTSELDSADTGITRNIADTDDTDDEDRVNLVELGTGYGNEDTAAALPPVGAVDQSLGYDPLMQAFSSHTIGDPYIASRSYAPQYRVDATGKVKTWRTPNLKHRPLYFEDAALERHGQSLPKMQPVVSGARFFSTLVLLPQKVLATPPTECVHPVGYGRPGNCVPKVRETLPRRDE